MTNSENKALEHLRRLIKMGHYVEHGRLPAERVLAKDLDVGRGDLRKALSTLESEGKITRFVGRGTYVGSGPNDDPTLSSGVFASAPPGEVMEARLILEPRLAAMAAVNADDQDIEYLLLCVQKSKLATDWDVWERWDSTFHRTIALCSHNNLMAEIIEKFNKIRSRKEWQVMRDDKLSQDWHSSLVSQHQKIADCIATRDPRRAAKAMRAHLKAVEHDLFDSDESDF